jgi:hypothetical protein
VCRLLKNFDREKLLSLSFDEVWKSKFKIMSFEGFWMAISDAYPLLQAKAFKMFCPLSTSYYFIKNKYRSKLDLEHNLRVKLSNIVPRYLSQNP